MSKLFMSELEVDEVRLGGEIFQNEPTAQRGQTPPDQQEFPCIPPRWHASVALEPIA
jgi:hypothetical protein